MGDIASMFDGMDKAKTFGSGQYFGEGKFLLRVKSVKMNDGHNGKAFIAEFDVLQAEQQVGEDGKYHDPVKSIRSWVVKLPGGSKNGNAFSDIKSFAFALTGHDPKAVGQPEENPELHRQAAEVVKVACDVEYAKKLNMSNEIFIGRYVGLQTHMKATKPSTERPQGGKFTVHSYFPVDQTQAHAVYQASQAAA